MKRHAGSLVVVVVFCFFLLPTHANAQVDKIVIPAGTPEDHDLQAITNEQDAAKKLAMYQDFVQKYSSNPAAVAYGNWQLSQAYQAAGDLNKALDYGDKALVGSPRDLRHPGVAGQHRAAGERQHKVSRLCGEGRDGLQLHRQAAQAGGNKAGRRFQETSQEEDKSAAKRLIFLESAGFNAIVE